MRLLELGWHGPLPALCEVLMWRNCGVSQDQRRRRFDQAGVVDCTRLTTEFRRLTQYETIGFYMDTIGRQELWSFVDGFAEAGITTNGGIRRGAQMRPVAQ